MNFDRATCKSTCKWLVVASLGTAALLMANAAQAQNQGVYWSLGLSSPGVQVGIGNAQPVFVQPIQRVIVVPQQPVYLQPQAGYYEGYYPGYSAGYYPGYSPVYGRPEVAYPPVVQPVYGGGWHHQHRHHGYGHVDARREEWRAGPRDGRRY